MYFITQAKIVGSTQFIVKQDRLTWIPMDPNNTEYQQYLAWLADGNSPTELSDDGN